MKERINYTDLITFTDTYTLLFAPYILLHNQVIAEQLYGTDLCNAILNVYPMWDKKESESIYTGHVFMVLDMNKITNMAQVRYMYADNDCVTSVTVPAPVGGRPDAKDADGLMIVTFKLPDDLCFKFRDGKFSDMFDKDSLFDNKDSFIVDEGGIITQVSKDIEIRLSKAYHILTRSALYERVLAAKLGVPERDFVGKLTELQSGVDFKDEELNLELLIKQLRSNGW